MRRLLTATRSIGGLALACATTAVAAANYDNGTTAHGLFKLPVKADPMDQEPIVASLPPRCQQLELLNASTFIVWDEFPSAHRECFEAAYSGTDGIANTVFVATGDFRQIGPVVAKGSRPESASASILCSPTWKLFQVLELTESYRDRLDLIMRNTYLVSGMASHCTKLGRLHLKPLIVQRMASNTCHYRSLHSTKMKLEMQ